MEAAIFVSLLTGFTAYVAGRLHGAAVGWRRAMRMIRDFNDAQPERARMARATGEVLTDQRWNGCPVCDECEPARTVNTEA